jgi:hypothetical protein
MSKRRKVRKSKSRRKEERTRRHLLFRDHSKRKSFLKEIIYISI